MTFADRTACLALIGVIFLTQHLLFSLGRQCQISFKNLKVNLLKKAKGSTDASFITLKLVSNIGQFLTRQIF